MKRKDNIIPGFNLTLGITTLYISVMIILPLAVFLLRSTELGLDAFITNINSKRFLNALLVTFKLSFLAALANAFFGTVIAWCLVRYQFFGKQMIDAVVDLPFALPTAVAGIALTSVYADNGLIGGFFASYGISIAFTQKGIFLALIFVGLPFVIRTLQPVIEELDFQVEEAALTMGASAFEMFCKIILPALAPAILTGFTLAFARGLGEYGSVIFIAGNLPNYSEIVPVLIMSKLEAFDYNGAISLSFVMLVLAFMLLLIINYLQSNIRRRYA